ncbi:MAG: hypothetical protein L3K16_08020 [Thermoplasmata archaeon]|nr:hypothetical protein [Thermoplasmata archaeon]
MNPRFPVPNIPSLARRIVYATLRLVGLLIFFVAIPLGLLNLLMAHGIHPPVSLLTVSTVGILLSVIGAAGTIARPTRAYGPIAMSGAVLFFLYLIFLARNGVLSVGIGSGGTFQLSYGSAILLIAVAPVLSAIAATLTTIEDVNRPGQRLPFDYPPKRRRG